MSERWETGKISYSQSESDVGDEEVPEEALPAASATGGSIMGAGSAGGDWGTAATTSGGFSP